jgi:hypothetical protein
MGMGTVKSGVIRVAPRTHHRLHALQRLRQSLGQGGDAGGKDQLVRGQVGGGRRDDVDRQPLLPQRLVELEDELKVIKIGPLRQALPGPVRGIVEHDGDFGVGFPH